MATLTHTHSPPPICLSVSFSALQEIEIPGMPLEVFLEEEDAGALAALRGGEKNRDPRLCMLCGWPRKTWIKVSLLTKVKIDTLLVPMLGPQFFSGLTSSPFWPILHP